MIKIIWNMAVPGAGKTKMSMRLIELLTESGFNATFMDDKIPFDEAVWEDVSRFLHDPSRRTPEGGVRGEHSLVLNPDDGIGSLSVETFDGHGLNTGHEKFFEHAKAYLATAGEGDVFVFEGTPGVDDYSFGPDKIPVIHNPGWWRRQIIERDFLSVSLINEVIADEEVRLRRNSSRNGHHIPEAIMRREFPDKARFGWQDLLMFGDRYNVIRNNGEDVDEFLARVEERYQTFIFPRLMEGQGRGPEMLPQGFRR